MRLKRGMNYRDPRMIESFNISIQSVRSTGDIAAPRVTLYRKWIRFRVPDCAASD